MSESDQNKVFMIGDVVQLKSGGEKMTVHAVTNEGIRCTWFRGQKIEFETFQSEQLCKSGPFQINIYLDDPKQD